MTICREWSIVKHLPQERLAKALKCRSWGCEHCQPERKAQLLAKAACGRPTRFITLTINPRVGESPEARLALLANSWRLIVKRLRRRHPSEPVEFLAVVEETKNGEPHLHILMRGPYIPQKLLSTWMAELAESPIVDIRKINSVSKAVLYVAKYIAKKPAQFGTAKRYWTSGQWETDYEKPTEPAHQADYKWTIDRRPLHEIARAWWLEGWKFNASRRDWLTGSPNDIFDQIEQEHQRAEYLRNP